MATIRAESPAAAVDAQAPRLVLGTRGSALALVQAEATEQVLARSFPGLVIERRIIKTTGDRRTDVSLAEVAKSEGTFDKGVFIKELEQELAAGTIDLAVHSLKDLPSVLDPRFLLAAVLERAPVRDVLVTRDGSDFQGLPEGARVGTSSVRRARQVTFLRPDLVITDLRGNVPTRLRKLADGGAYDAILLAEAGLVRLGFLPTAAGPGVQEPIEGMDGLFACRLAEDLFFPAAGQGAIGLEIRRDDESCRSLVEAIGDEETWLRVTAEREFLRLLDAGCHTPVGVFSTIDTTPAGGALLHLKARVFPEAEGPPRTAEARGSDALEVARNLFESLS